MLFILWTNQNEIGIPILDEQHRSIVSTINTLHYYFTNDMGDEAIRPVHKILEQYTVLHFHTEEALMKKAGFPDFDAHVQLHEELVRQNRAIIRNWSETKDPAQILEFLKDWWLGHINKKDRDYVPYVKKLQ